MDPTYVGITENTKFKNNANLFGALYNLLLTENHETL